MEKFKINFHRFLTILIYVLICYVFAELLKNVLVKYIGDDYLLLSTLINSIPYIIMFVSIIVLMRGEIKTDFMMLKHSDAYTVFKICLMGVVSGYFANMLGSMVSGLFGGVGESANQEAVTSLIVSKYGVIFGFVTIIMAPVVEELVFRKALHGILRTYKVPNGFILLISSVLFGLIHVLLAGDFVYIFPYIFMGVVLGGLELNTHNIYPSMIVHMVNNGIAFFMAIIMNAMGPLLPQI